jgi:hypothetical protein
MIYVFLPHVPVEPIGGVQTLFDYVERLNELAKTQVAVIVCQENYVRSLLPRSYPLVPILYQQPQLNPTDVLIFPEVLVNEIQKYPAENPKYLAVLNWRYLEVFTQKSKQPFPQLNGILTNSQYTLKKLREKYPHISITHIPHVIESRFKRTISLSQRTKNSILILNRKNTNHVPGILAFLENIPHQVTLVNNVDPTELIQLYNQHQIFINLGYPEGFCRPAAEAMACGNIVVGFTGGGGSDFMNHGFNSFIAPDGDEQQLIKLLSHVMHAAPPAELKDISDAAVDTIHSTYTKANQAKALYTLFKTYMPSAISITELNRMYKSARLRNTAEPTKPLYTHLNQETLEYKLFHERQMNKAVTSSKFFSMWQKYCSFRDSLREKTHSLSTHIQH